MRASEKLHINTQASLRVRCSQPLSTNQTPHPTTKDEATTSPIPGFPHSGRRDSGPVVSKPNSVSGNSSPATIPHRLNVCRAPEPHPLQAWPIHRIAQNTEPPHNVSGPGSRGAP